MAVAAEPIVLPMDLSSGRPVVPATVNGSAPVKLLVDTGGPLRGGAVGSDLGRTLGLAPTGEKVMVSSPAGGTPFEVELLGVPSLRIGSLEVRNSVMRASARPLPGADILVSTSIFRESGKIVELDFARKELRLVDAATLPVSRWFPIHPGSGHFHLDVEVGGKTMSAVLDTGSPFALTAPVGSVAQFSLAAPPKVVGRARTVDREFEVLGATLQDSVIINGIRLASTELRFAPFPRIVVGTPSFEGLVIVVDWANMRFSIVKAPAAAQ